MIDEEKLIESLRSSLNTGRETFPLDIIIDCIEEQPKVGEWIPAGEPPKNDDYILLSFENYSELLIGRYDTDEDGNGAYYLGDCDEEDTCMANDLYVNAWQPLPQPYQPKGE